jgi:dCMP deaminase
MLAVDTVPAPPLARPSFETIYMNLAVQLSSRSTCSRLSVGCAIVSTDYRYVFGVGYNGGAAGLSNECESDIPGQCGHLHAEENACINCREERSTPKVVLVTHLPCKMCAKRLVNLGGVKRVLYLNDYRIRDSLEVLHSAGIIISQFVPGEQ